VVDVVLVSAWAGPGAAGVYGTLTRYITAGNFLIFSLGQAGAPGLRRALAGPDPAAAQRLLRQATGWMVLVAWPYLLLVAVKSDPLIRLLNPGFGHRGTALVVLAVFMLVSALAGPVDLALLMLGRSRSSLLAVAVALSVNIGLDWLLVPRLGLVGAALGWGLAVACQNGLATWLVHRSGRLGAVGRPALLAATGATLAVVPIGVATPDTLAGLVITVAVAGVIYLGWMARFASVLNVPTVSRLRGRRSVGSGADGQSAQGPAPPVGSPTGPDWLSQPTTRAMACLDAADES
jgi:O-antigen/teichoic acid export membrane protein